jgi:hypothetical protein
VSESIFYSPTDKDTRPEDRDILLAQHDLTLALVNMDIVPRLRYLLEVSFTLVSCSHLASNFIMVCFQVLYMSVSMEFILDILMVLSRHSKTVLVLRSTFSCIFAHPKFSRQCNCDLRLSETGSNSLCNVFGLKRKKCCRYFKVLFSSFPDQFEFDNEKSRATAVQLTPKVFPKLPVAVLSEIPLF